MKQDSAKAASIAEKSTTGISMSVSSRAMCSSSVSEATADSVVGMSDWTDSDSKSIASRTEDSTENNSISEASALKSSD